MKKNLLITAAASIVLVASANAATVIHSFGVDNNAANAPAAGVVITSWADIGVDGSATSYTSSAIAGSVGGEAFTYTVTVASTGATPNLDLQGTANLLGDGGTFNSGNGATITISIVTGNVQFDGFNSLATGSTADGEGATVNGTTYIKSVDGINGQGYFALGGSLAATESTFVHTSSGTTTPRWVDASFSTVPVPEPSSTALLGLGGLALILRRRK